VRVRSFDELRFWLQCSIDDVLCVSFDIFDTLLRRCIEPPGNLQRRVAELLAGRIGMGIHTDAVLQARLETEAELRHSALFNGRDHECHFDSPAEKWIRRLVGYSDPELVEFVHSTERDIESCALSAKPAAVDMLNWLRDCGVRVIAVSDMYLSHAHITRLLDNCGVGRLLDRIYVSSEFGMGKIFRPPLCQGVRA
jgi:FMN phosphatase YigB (HAD superfamily)